MLARELPFNRDAEFRSAFLAGASLSFRSQRGFPPRHDAHSKHEQVDYVMRIIDLLSAMRIKPVHTCMCVPRIWCRASLRKLADEAGAKWIAHDTILPAKSRQLLALTPLLNENHARSGKPLAITGALICPSPQNYGTSAASFRARVKRDRALHRKGSDNEKYISQSREYSQRVYQKFYQKQYLP